MYGLMYSAIIVSIIMGISLFIGIIPSWDWLIFFAALLVMGRITASYFKWYYNYLMRLFLDKYENQFSGEEIQMLKVASGILVPPERFFSESIRSDTTSLNTWLQILAIVIGGVALCSGYIYIVGITLLVFLTGPKIWQPSSFYTGNEDADNIDAVSIYIKAQGKSLNHLSSDEVTSVERLYMDVKDKFHNILHIYER